MFGNLQMRFSEKEDTVRSRFWYAVNCCDQIGHGLKRSQRRRLRGFVCSGDIHAGKQLGGGVFFRRRFNSASNLVSLFKKSFLYFRIIVLTPFCGYSSLYYIIVLKI